LNNCRPVTVVDKAGDWSICLLDLKPCQLVIFQVSRESAYSDVDKRRTSGPKGEQLDTYPLFRISQLYPCSWSPAKFSLVNDQSDDQP